MPAATGFLQAGMARGLGQNARYSRGGECCADLWQVHFRRLEIGRMPDAIATWARARSTPHPVRSCTNYQVCWGIGCKSLGGRRQAGRGWQAFHAVAFCLLYMPLYEQAPCLFGSCMAMRDTVACDLTYVLDRAQPAGRGGGGSCMSVHACCTRVYCSCASTSAFFLYTDVTQYGSDSSVHGHTIVCLQARMHAATAAWMHYHYHALPY